MGWLFAVGLVVVALALRGRGASAADRAPAPSPPAPPVPPPAPEGRDVVVSPAIDETTHDGGVISPPEPVPDDEALPLLPSTEGIPPDLLAVVQMGPDASDQDLERAAATSRGIGRIDLEEYFVARLARRRRAAFEEHEGETARGRYVPPRPVASTSVRQALGTESREMPELPVARESREQLMRLATLVADDLRRRPARGYDRALMRNFQAAAGLRADGMYGWRTKQALGHYGRMPSSQVPEAQY